MRKVAVPVGLAMLKVARHGADQAVLETADIRALSRSASRPALDLHHRLSTRERCRTQPTRQKTRLFDGLARRIVWYATASRYAPVRTRPSSSRA
ncbi:hypothetical protein [Paraburkholderia sp. BL25I1N1]|uniref:hypothetical protein n=1 Tax=Paraburkholderia sp. BL25I1N1 TaxID=1938804 RepID=UPI0021592F47|nr:hypothetical protein [Paraburkholderia sp. BL25I1N1]